VQIVARLDSNYHAHLFGLINCSQFNRAKPIHLIIDTGSSNTTLLSDDVTKLAINCSGLQFAQFPCLTANGTITPYTLPEVDLLLLRRCGWLNRKTGLVTFHMANIHCMPPTHPQFLTQQQLLQSYSLLGMDVLQLFKKWRFTQTELILKS
jgi:hypothetical protein